VAHSGIIQNAAVTIINAKAGKPTMDLSVPIVTDEKPRADDLGMPHISIM
jgi:hypothetical protein